MKKLSAILCAFLAAVLLCSCGNAKDSEKGTAEKGDTLVEKFETVIDANEYLLYQNVFYNKMADDYVGSEQTKKGVFVTLHDRFNETTRYYVWGYYDQTKCCDWQWEINPEGLGDALPADGSTVSFTGTFAANDKALDKYWFDGVTLSVEKEYTGKQYDVNMCLMNATLERVQIVNMQKYADYFEGKTVSAYGRVFNLNHIQHPYYDSTWTQEFKSNSDTLPAIGTPVVTVGTYRGGVISDCIIEATTAY